MLTAETVKQSVRRLLPIIRTDAGGFFGLGEHEGPHLDKFEGRFAHLIPPKRLNAENREMTRALLAAMGVTEDRLRGDAGWN